MKLKDLEAVTRIARHQGELEALAKAVDSGAAGPWIGVSNDADDYLAFPGSLVTRDGMRFIPLGDAVSEGAYDALAGALLAEIRRMQQINREALASYGVEE